MDTTADDIMNEIMEIGASTNANPVTNANAATNTNANPATNANVSTNVPPGAQIVGVEQQEGQEPIFEWNLAMNNIDITPYVDPNPLPEPRQVPQIPTPIAQRVQQRRTRTNNPGAPSTDVPSTENSEVPSSPQSRPQQREASDIARLADITQEDSDFSSFQGDSEIVDLSRTRCVAVPPNVLELTNVKGLILSDNDVGPTVQLSPELMKHLVLLDLESNNIDTFPDISSCHELRLLNLDNNVIRKFDSLNTHLIELRIANNQLKSLSGVTHFPRLSRLDIRANKLATITGLRMLSAFSELKILHLADNPITQRNDDKLRVFLLHTLHHVHCFDVRVHREVSRSSSPTKFINKHAPPTYLHPPQFYERCELLDAAQTQGGTFHWHHYLDHLAGVIPDSTNLSHGQVNKVTTKAMSSTESGGGAQTSSVFTPSPPSGYLRPLEKTNKKHPELNTRTQHAEFVAQAKKVATKKVMKEVSDQNKFVSPRKLVRSQKLNDGADRHLDTPVRAIMCSLTSQAAPTSLRTTSLIHRASKHLNTMREEDGSERQGHRNSDGGSSRDQFKGSMGTITNSYATAHKRTSDALLARGFRRRGGGNSRDEQQIFSADSLVKVPDNLPTSPTSSIPEAPQPSPVAARAKQMFGRNNLNTRSKQPNSLNSNNNASNLMPGKYISDTSNNSRSADVRI